MSIALTSLTSATFTDCCFAGKEGEETAAYVSLAGTGTATFTKTCFDLAQEKSVSPGEIVCTYDDEEYMFGKCTCNPYEPIKPEETSDTEELGSSTDEEDPDVGASSASDEVDDETSSSSDDGGSDPDNSNKDDPTNVPMIAGIVVGVVVVIAIVAVLLFFFVFRKRRNNEKTSDADDFGDDTGSNIAETVELTGEADPAAATSVSPFFQEPGTRHDFSDVFEEANENI